MEVIKNSIPVIVAVVAAVLAYGFSISSEGRKQKQQNRTQAYIDFLKGTAIVAQSQRDGNKKVEFEGFVLITDAKQRILIYGSDRVIKMLAEFIKNGANITGENAEKYMKLIQEMRRESKSKTSVSLQDISNVLFEKR